MELEAGVQAALTNASIDRLTYYYSLSQAFNQELARELIDSWPRVGQAIGSMVIDLLFSLIPIPGLNTVLTGVRDSIKLETTRQSWVTAFSRLRKEE